MTKWKIGLVILGLISAVGCGDSDSGDGEGTGENGNGGGMTDTDSGPMTPVVDSGTTGGAKDAGPTTGGSDAGSSTGTPATGACTNAADKAIIDAATVAKLGCEGGACAGKTIGRGAAAQTKCIAEDAPTLKQLSTACQKCFDEITSCVPSKCVSLPPVFMGSGECPLTAPNDDFAKCPSTTPPDAKCQTCQMRDCAPAFITCSGISM